MELRIGRCYRIAERGGHTIRAMAIGEFWLQPLPGFLTSFFRMQSCIDVRLIELDSALSIWEDTEDHIQAALRDLDSEDISEIMGDDL